MHRLETMPEEVQEGVFLKLFNQCEIANYNPKEYMAYEESVKTYRDWYAITKTIKDKSREEGRKAGLEEGIEKGIEKERKEGKKRRKEKASKSHSKSIAAR